VLAELAKESWDDVLTAPSIHLKVDALHTKINHYLDKHCPYKVCRIRKDNPQWVTPGLLKLIKARDRAYKKGCKSFKALKTITQRKIRTDKRKFIHNKLNSNLNSKQWWSTLKSIIQPSGSSQKMSRQIVIEGQNLTPAEFCTQLNEHFAKVGGQSIHRNGLPPNCQEHQKSLDEVSLGEIKLMLSKLNTTKATSDEDFPTWISLDGREDMCIPLHDIINCMLVHREFPNKWKRAQICPIPKIAHPTRYKEYRPIALLFHLGKLAEDIIIQKMRGTLNRIIEPSQYAYQPGIGTTDALLDYVDTYTSLLDKRDIRFIQSASLDFSKAFDRLQPSLLVEKMNRYSFNENVVALVSSFLNNRMQCVKAGGFKSKYISCNVGAPQGTKLGPVFWLIYANDLQIPNFKHIKYADDTTLFQAVHNPKDHQPITTAISITQHWSVQNSMMLNAEKTSIMNTSYRHTYNQPINIGDIEIEPCTKTRFLGITIDNRLSFNDHVKAVSAKCNSLLYLMRKLKMIGMNNEGLRKFYTTNIRSKVSYSAPAWYTMLSTENTEKLEQIQRKATKIIIPEATYDERLTALHLPRLSDYLLQLSRTHFIKIAANKSHPLHTRITFNSNRRSTRNSTVYCPERCRTSKRANSFFNYFMANHNSY
jgi:hypothetical protein